MAGLDVVSEECRRRHAASLRFDDNGFVVIDALLSCVVRIDFDEGVFRVQLAEYCRLRSASLCVPLAGRASTCQKHEWIR